MKTQKNHRRRIGALSRGTALLLSVLMMVCAYPFTGFAVGQSEAAPAVSGANESEPEAVASGEDAGYVPSVLGELPAEREETVKHFRMSDDSYIAVSYGQAVHYTDEDGELEDIDNTLVFSAGKDAQPGSYKTKAGGSRYSFSELAASGAMVTLDDGEYSIELSVAAPTSKSRASISNPERKEEVDTTNIALATALPKLKSSVVYTGAVNGCDIEYITSGENLKENIIIRKTS